MFEGTEQVSSSVDTAKNRWRYRVAFTANVYLDIETDSAETPDQDLERLAIEAVRLGSKDGRDLPLDEAGIDIPSLPGGRLYAEPNIDGGLEAFSIEDCYELKD
ncbi:MAG: hypothetical protein ACR2JB_13235 [Bryobacteraceae bacterium]